MRAWLIGLFFFVPAAAVVISSCALEDFTKIPDVVDAGEDGGCRHATVPLPPDPATIPPDAGLLDSGLDAGADGGTDTTFVVALHEILMKKAKDGSDLGLDLDRFCSCQGETPSCVPPPGQPAELRCDLADGRDNKTPVLFTLVEATLKQPDLSVTYSDYANLGRWTLLFRVSGYNGEPNDSKVRVDWYMSGGMPAVPIWDGTDLWPIPDTTVLNNDVNQPRYYDPAGYVTDGKLVFSVPEGRLDIAGATRISLKLTAGTVMARIDKNDKGQYVLRDGTIAARIAVEDLFAMISSFRDFQGNGFCTDDALYGAAKDAFCRGLDIQKGFAEPNKPCDAASFALGFSSDPAMLGPVEPPVPSPSPCTPDKDPLTEFLMTGCPQQ